MTTLQVGQFIRCRGSQTIWQILRFDPDDGLPWGWSNGRGERKIKRPENYEVIEDPPWLTLPAGAGGWLDGR